MSEIQIRENRILAEDLKPNSTQEILVLFSSLVKKRKWIYLLVGVTVLATTIFCLFLPNKYTAKAVILPSGGTTDKLGGLKEFTGLMGDFSLGVSSSNLENSSFLYPDILKSRLLSEAVINKVYEYPQGRKIKRQSLFSYFRAKKMDRAIKALAGITIFNMERKTGVITVSVTTKNRYLSAAVANEYINQLEEYNLGTRKSKAKENEKFIAKRLEEVQGELTQAENNLEAFQSENRNFYTSTSPELAMELARLEREVEIKSKVFLTLTQQYELARVEAKKDVPIVQVLDYAKPPEQKAGPNRKLIILASVFLSSFVGIGMVLSTELIKTKVKPDEYKMALDLGGEFKGDMLKVYGEVRKPLGWFRRIKIKHKT
ncbi:MAG TPA: GNVR domain-containing protein [candidate division Zixibacteria bacterium]